jgi:Na+/proline symporter
VSLGVDDFRHPEGYLVANRSVGRLAHSLSSGVATFSGWLYLGLPGAAYREGWRVLWLIGGSIAGYVLAYGLVAKTIRRFSHRNGPRTVGELLVALREDPWSRRLQALVGFGSLIFLSAHLAAQMSALFKVSAALGPGSFSQSAAPIGIVALVVLVGLRGVRSAVVSDVIKALLSVGFVFVLPIYVFIHGSIPPDRILPLLSGATPATHQPAWHTFAYVVSCCAMGLGHMGQPQLIARMLSAKAGVVDATSLALSASVKLLAMLGAAASGIVSGALLAQKPTDPERVLLAASLQSLPTGLSILVLLGTSAAIVSASGNFLIAAVGSASHDLLGRSRGHQVTGAIWAFLILGSAALLWRLHEGSVLAVAQFAWAGLFSVCGAPLGYLLIANRPRASVAFGAATVGAGTVILWFSLGLSPVLYELVPSLVLQVLFVGVANLYQRA